ncbi:MAG: hypothetical protein KAW93_00680 [Methanogenium sp.]|nr:hypothetical protein [Methanogenium sp.]
MNCPGPNEESYAICLQCRACMPGLPQRVSEILEICFEIPGYVTIVGGVLA